MSESAIEGQGSLEGISQGQTEEVSSDTGSINPAWNDVLSVIPEELHSQITPHFSKWDQNYQNGINKVHSQYEPYKHFVENNVPADQINYAMSVLQAIETNPKEVLNALQAYIGETDDEQGQNNQQTDDGSLEQPEWLNHPEFKKMNEMVNTMAQLLVQQRQAEQQAKEDAEIEQELSSLREELGEFDEEWVLTKMMSDEKLTLRQAVESWKAFEQGIISKARQPGPKVLGSGGSIPSQELNVKELGSKEKRNLMVQILENARNQS